MTIIHDLIDEYDIIKLNNYLFLKNSNEINQPNNENVYPIEYVISIFDPKKHHIKTHCVFVQMLLNKGCHINHDFLNELKQDNTISSETHKLIDMVLDLKPLHNVDKFTSKKNQIQETRRQSRNITTISQKSNYSNQELLQLQQCAEKHGIISTPVNHLALRIIHQLEKLLEQYGHY